MTEKALRVVVLKRLQTIRSPGSQERHSSVVSVCEILKINKKEKLVITLVQNFS